MSPTESHTGYPSKETLRCPDPPGTPICYDGGMHRYRALCGDLEEQNRYHHTGKYEPVDLVIRARGRTEALDRLEKMGYFTVNLTALGSVELEPPHSGTNEVGGLG